MDNQLKEKLDEFIASFLEVKEVKQYLLLKKQIEESEEIKELETNIKLYQKQTALSLGTSEYAMNKAKYLSYKNEYDNHPLIVNYNVLLEEVEYLLKELEIKLKY